MADLPATWEDCGQWMADRGIPVPAEGAGLGTLSDATGRAFTMLLALERLGGSRALASGERLSLLILGPDAREGSNEQELAATFEPFARALLACASPASQPAAAAIDLLLVLVGPNLPHAASFSREVCGPAGGRRARIRVECVPRMLHEEESAAALALPPAERFSAAFAFNAGLWGYESWAKSLARLGALPGRVPLVVTSYNELEADEDAGALEDMGLEEARDWRWAPERNRFGSTREWQNSLGRTASDNGWWQCASVGPLAARGAQ
jgi:hypothetical protein